MKMPSATSGMNPTQTCLRKGWVSDGLQSGHRKHSRAFRGDVMPGCSHRDKRPEKPAGDTEATQRSAAAEKGHHAKQGE